MYIYIYLIKRYLFIYGMRAGEQAGSPLTVVGCGMPHEFSLSFLWKSWQAQGSLQSISSVSLCTTEGDLCSVLGHPGAAVTHTNTPSSAPQGQPSPQHLLGFTCWVLALLMRLFSSV